MPFCRFGFEPPWRVRQDGAEPLAIGSREEVISRCHVEGVLRVQFHKNVYCLTGVHARGESWDQ